MLASLSDLSHRRPSACTQIVPGVSLAILAGILAERKLHACMNKACKPGGSQGSVPRPQLHWHFCMECGYGNLVICLQDMNQRLTFVHRKRIRPTSPRTNYLNNLLFAHPQTSSRPQQSRYVAQTLTVVVFIPLESVVLMSHDLVGPRGFHLGLFATRAGSRIIGRKPRGVSNAKPFGKGKGRAA